MAIEAFGTALRAIPSTIAENAGLDSAELVTQLRAEHAKEGSKAGVDVIRGAVSVKRVKFRTFRFLFVDLSDVYVRWRLARLDLGANLARLTKRRRGQVRCSCWFERA
jgi:hypothetical protein